MTNNHRQLDEYFNYYPYRRIEVGEKIQKGDVFLYKATLYCARIWGYIRTDSVEYYRAT